MAGLPPPGSEFGCLHPARPLSNLDNPHTHLHESHSSPQLHPASDWRPRTIGDFNAWNHSSQGIFPSTLVGPGQNPNRDLPPPRPARTTNTVNPGKRRQTTLTSVDSTSSVGGYGPLSSEETAADASSSSPSPPPSASNTNHTTRDIWPFARPLLSSDVPPADQWPTSMEPYLVRKPKTSWIGCKLCSQFGSAIHLSIFRNLYTNSHPI